MLEAKEEIRKAVEQASAGRVTLWNARLDLATRIGDAKLIDHLLAHSPIADGGGCDCHCGGVETTLPQQVTNPVV